VKKTSRNTTETGTYLTQKKDIRLRLWWIDCNIANTSLWRHFLSNEKILRFLRESNTTEVHGLSDVREMRLPSYLQQCIVTEAEVINSEETTISPQEHHRAQLFIPVTGKIINEYEVRCI
jgi:hypothetical protein